LAHFPNKNNNNVIVLELLSALIGDITIFN